MKYVMVIGDGMADYPVEEYGGKTPLQIAEHPNMDMIMSNGICGTLQTIPPNMDTGSDVAIMSILGYDPRKYFTGRGPLEALAMGVKLEEDEIAFRCNLITEKEGMLFDYSAGHIGTEEACELIVFLEEALGRKYDVRFHAGVSYRHILVLKGEKYSEKLKCTPPHDALGEKLHSILIKPTSQSAVETANLLNMIMLKSRSVLSAHPINLRRTGRGEKPANMVWFWSPGRRPKLPIFQESYGVKGAIISAVNLVKGIGVCVGMDVIDVPGATGFVDTDYEGKADYAIQNLTKHDMAVVHVESIDEASHMGDFNLKVKAIEDLDKRLIGRLLKKLEGDYTIAALTDHATPIKLKTHTRDPVPFAVYSSFHHKKTLKKRRFDEEHAKRCGLNFDAPQFIPFFLNPKRFLS